MKKLNISLLLCFFLTLSSLSYAESNLKTSVTKPPSAISHNDFPNIFRPVGNFFKRIVGIKPKPIYCPPPAYVKSLSLNKTEVVMSCAIKSFCSKTDQRIEVTSEGYDSENDVLTYVYHITGGKIVGVGSQVIWDLSGAPLGTYTITAGVDDGCGVCGQTITKEVKVVECGDCQNP